jgi:DNA sulfur modification protein DndC
MSDLNDLPGRLRAIRREIRDEYLQPHTKPWVIGFSAGKDSTLLLHLVLEALLAASPDRRVRPVHILLEF